MILDVKLSTDQTFNASFVETQAVIDTNISKPTGENGLSAYEIAVANGFEGTEAEWLASLVGPQGPAGPKGDTGETGAQGIQGKPGNDGYTPIRGTDYWTDNDIAEIKGYVEEAILGGAW